MPGWQQTWPQLEGKINFLSIAIDAQGPTAVQPWLERAKTTFQTVVDQENVLPDKIGFNAVPTLLLFTADWRLLLGPITFDIRREGMTEAIIAWSNDGTISERLAQHRMGEDNANEAGRLFREGQRRLAQGDRQGALDAWQQARDIAPQNWLIRKQIWAVEHPDKFYAGPVDFDWQRTQLALE